MIVGANGLTGLGTAIGGAVGGQGSNGLAAEFGGFGAAMLASGSAKASSPAAAAGTAVAAAPQPITPQAPAEQARMLPPGSTAALQPAQIIGHLVTSTDAPQMHPPGAVAVGAGEPIPASPGANDVTPVVAGETPPGLPNGSEAAALVAGEMVPALPGAKATAGSPLTPAASRHSSVAAEGEGKAVDKPIDNKAAEAIAPAPPWDLDTQDRGPATGDAVAEIASDPGEALEPGPEQPGDGQADSADAPEAPAAPSNTVVRAQLDGPAQAAPARSFSALHVGETQEIALGDGRKPQPAATELSTGIATAPEASPDVTAEPFARLMPSAAPERMQPQVNSAPASPVTSSGLAQHVHASPQPLAAAHVPSSESHPVMPFRPDTAAREMGVEIARRVLSGGDELVIRLDPAELGRINIRMSVNENGQLRAIISADAPSVIEVIRGDVSELSRALEQAGVRTDGQSFRFDRGGSGDPNSQWQQRYQQQHAAGSQGDTSNPPVSEDQTAYRRMATNGRINMMA